MPQPVRGAGPESDEKPTGMYRPKLWSPEVEEAFRLQCVGWRDVSEYAAVYGPPERWTSNGFIKKLQVKKTGYYTYWREHAECEPKHVPQVKVYTYGPAKGK